MQKKHHVNLSVRINENIFKSLLVGTECMFSRFFFLIVADCLPQVSKFKASKVTKCNYVTWYTRKDHAIKQGNSPYE